MSQRSKSNSRNARAGSANASKQGGRQQQQLRNGPPQNEVKKRVGNYVIGNTVGEGTFGKVKCAIHIPTGEKVAVKILEKKRIQEQADVRRVNREIKILKKAKHGNIIQLFEVLDTPNSIYLIMENADGGEMFDYIVKHRHVNEKQACKFFHQILNGVEELHKNEITHRDLKPENLLLKASAQGWLIKIVDFGLSNTHDGGRLLSTACGSPCYAAPEMIAGKKYKGPGADTWSLGVILFALVCGYLPFEDPNTSNLYRKILSGDYKTPKWISPEVKDLIRKILETKPEKRLTINKIREHVWMKSVPKELVPRDEPNDEDEATFVKDAVVQRLNDEKVDVQAVLDAVSSHACNALSAFYYLLAQKELSNYREKKGRGEDVGSGNLKNIPSNRTEISQASSSKPESTSAPEKHQAQQQHQQPPSEKKSQQQNHPPSQGGVAHTGKVKLPSSIDTSEQPADNDPSRMVPVVSPTRNHNPAEPVVLNKIPDQNPNQNAKIPRLDLGKTQELRIEGTLQSQTARPQGVSPVGTNVKNTTTIAPINTSNGGAQSARPVLYEDVPHSNKENKLLVEKNNETELGGTLADFFPKDISSPDKRDLPDGDAIEERPNTRRSRSRRGESQGDGPGTGRIEYEDTKKLTDRPMEPLTEGKISVKKETTLQPVMPNQPQRSNVSRGSNRRGRNIAKLESNPHPNSRGSAGGDPAIALNSHVTQVAPLGRPPSGSRSGSRGRQRQQQQQAAANKHHNVPDVKKPAGAGNSAREMAARNKHSQTGGYNIISGSKNKIAAI